MERYIDSVDIELTRGHRSTIACATYVSPGSDLIQATSEAVRNPEDDDDPYVATTLATGRALEALGNKLLKRANGRVTMHDNNRERAKRQAEQPRPNLCGASTKAGPPCRRRRIKGEQFCPGHRP
jgi:hypothetical protein